MAWPVSSLRLLTCEHATLLEFHTKLLGGDRLTKLKKSLNPQHTHLELVKKNCTVVSRLSISGRAFSTAVF